MTPTSYSKKEDGTTVFHYKPSEIIKFVREGKKHGNVGMLLISRKDGIEKYKGFGTIEYPNTEMTTFYFQPMKKFGEVRTDDEILAPPKPWFLEGEIILIEPRKQSNQGYKKGKFN